MGWVWAWVKMIKPALRQMPALQPTSRRALVSPLLVVFCAGINLILVQWILVRELTALLLGTELVTLLVSVAYFAGLSIGYKLSARLHRSWVAPLALITLVLHLTLPVWFRLLVIALSSGAAYGAALIVLPLLTALLVPAFYSVFLPLLVENDRSALPSVYALELLGSACGVIGLLVLGGVSIQAVYGLYALGALGLLLALHVTSGWLIASALISTLWILVFPAVNAWSNTLWYVEMARLPDGSTTVFTSYSPYQKVDVLETATGARYLFLDGLKHFGDSDGTRLNVAMGQIPAALVKPTNALVIGAGSMQMAAMIADHAGLVTTVEIDPVVVAASERYFDDFNRMSTLTNRRIVIDDAKHFVANSPEHYDLVAMDIPAAYSLQTATLYSAPFYSAIAQHLNPDGLLVANLTGTFSPTSLTARRIAASLLANFSDVLVYTPASAGWSFALASNHLTIDRDTLAAALQASGEAQFVIYDTDAVRAIVTDAPPITLDSLDIVLQTSLRWIADRWRSAS